MELQVYYGEHPRYRHEYDQLNELIGLVQGSDLEGPVFLLHNFLLSNSEIDCLLLCQNGMILLDLKAYLGVIRLEETCKIELLEEVRRVRIRTSSASNRFIFRVLANLE